LGGFKVKYLLVLLVLFFSGCQLDEKKAVLMQEKSVQNTPTAPQNAPNEEAQNRQNQIAIELEKIKAQNAKELQQMQLEAKQKELEITKELQTQENEIALSTHKDNLEFYKIALIIAAILTLFIVLVIYLIAKKNREAKIKMQEERLKSEYNLKQQEFYNERINKLLEIAASKESDESIKKDAMDMLKNDHTLRRLEYKND
jgi:uncharacterized membrane protein